MHPPATIELRHLLLEIIERPDLVPAVLAEALKRRDGLVIGVSSLGHEPRLAGRKTSECPPRMARLGR
jgi:hypothetical protein